jgi:NitT/TauT family transport system ATP-binding protein
MAISQSCELEKAPKILTIDGLNFGFKSQSSPVITNLALNIRRGEIVSLLGRSGCGKSTLLNLIAGLIKPLSGEIHISTEPSIKTKLGYIFQEGALLPWRTVAANLNLAIEIGGIAQDAFDQKRKEFFSSFHLDEKVMNQYPSQLSGGMKQRISIIQTLLLDPPLLLLDEPFSALDFYTRLSLETEFYNLVRTKNLTALLVTHDIEEAIALSDRIILLGDNGKIHAEHTIKFTAEPRDPETLRGLPEFGAYYRLIWEQFKAVSSL